MRLIYSITLFIVPLILNGQGGLFIKNGAHVVASDQLHIVVENGRFENNGNFSAANSTVHITGSAETDDSTIGGSSVTKFHHLQISKTSNDARLDFDIEVEGDLIMNGGNFILNHSDVDLGGSILGETAAQRITGTAGGTIIKTVDLNMPSGEKPGNIGFEITSSQNLGLTTIHRRHVQLTNNGNYSIYRHFDISPANNSGLDATLRIHYFDEELAGLMESNLKIWQFDGANWTSQSVNSNDPTANWVEAQGYSSFHTLTAAVEMIVLPVKLIDFQVKVNDSNKVDIFWSTATEINNDFFIVERSIDGVSFEKFAIVDGTGNSTTTQYYETSDPNPYAGINYYRLKQVDFDGTTTYSAIRTATINIDGLLQLYPNPMSNVLH